MNETLEEMKNDLIAARRAFGDFADDELETRSRIERIERTTLILLWVVIAYGVAGVVDTVASMVGGF